MFEGIQRNLSEALKKLRGRGLITETNIKEAMREVRRALLEADVNLTVVDTFIKRVTDQAVGQEVLRLLDPSEQIINIVYQELVRLMGPVDHKLPMAKDRPTTARTQIVPGTPGRQSGRVHVVDAAAPSKIFVTDEIHAVLPERR